MIYLDCAATSMQKPKTVSLAVIRAMQTMASPGRGCHKPAMLAADCVLNTRILLASYFNIKEPENVIFTSNATHALNIAICSLVSSGDKVVISGYEHNSVTRPLKASGARVIVAAAPLFDPQATIAAFDDALDGADCAVCTYVSNVFGYILPIQEISDLCRARNVPLIIDASQAAGALPIDFTALGAAFIAMPGHKGLLGPQGTGVLLCGCETKPLLYGGTGSNSDSNLMPEYLPERLEAGTHNVPGVAGLYSGVKYLTEMPSDTVINHERKLSAHFMSILSSADEIKIFRSENPKYQSGVVSILPEKLTVDELAERLGNAGICIRSGMHCAPTAHETAGTFETGTARFSFSPFNTLAEVGFAAETVKKILNKL